MAADPARDLGERHADDQRPAELDHFGVVARDPRQDPMLVEQAVNGRLHVPPRLAFDPDLDNDSYAHEIAAACDLATRARADDG